MHEEHEKKLDSHPHPTPTHFGSSGGGNIFSTQLLPQYTYQNLQLDPLVILRYLG